jgi:WD40 repeat protein
VRIELYDRKQTKFISAHTNSLSCMALSMDGKRLATTSDKGTLVRVWNTADGSLVQVGQRAGAASAGYQPGCVRCAPLQA